MAGPLAANSDTVEVSIANTSGRVLELLRSCQEITARELRETVEIQVGRFNLWASNIGVFAPRHASLDYRLRTAPIPRAAIEATLQTLCNHLLSILSGDAEPTDEVFDVFDRTAQPDLFVFGQKLLQHSDPEIDIRGSSLKLVEVEIGSLHQLSLAIRKASNRNSLVRVPKLVDRDEQYSVVRVVDEASKSVPSLDYEITAGFEVFVERALSSRWLRKLQNSSLDANVPGLGLRKASEIVNTAVATDGERKDATQSDNTTPVYDVQQEDKDLDLGPEHKELRRFLLRRCISMISVRRRQLTYFRAHQAKLEGRNQSQSVTRPLNSKYTPIEASNVLHIPLNTFKVEDETMQQQIGQPVNVPPQSETLPSEFESRLFRPAPSTAAPSSAVSSDASTLRSMGYFELPPAPELQNGQKEQMCPYCCLVLPAEVFSARRNSSRWRRHLLDDMQPYVCLFKYCNRPGITYRTFSEWQMHLDTYHDAAWECPLPHPDTLDSEAQYCYSTSAQFKDHIHVSHPDVVDEDISKLIQSSSHADILPQWCFVCLALHISTSSLQKCLAAHFQQAFLLALPPRDDIKDSQAVRSNEISSSAFSETAHQWEGHLPGIRSFYQEDSDEVEIDQIPKLTSHEFLSQLSAIDALPSSLTDSAQLNAWIKQPSDGTAAQSPVTIQSFADTPPSPVDSDTFGESQLETIVTDLTAAEAADLIVEFGDQADPEPSFQGPEPPADIKATDLPTTEQKRESVVAKMAGNILLMNATFDHTQARKLAEQQLVDWEGEAAASAATSGRFGNALQAAAARGRTEAVQLLLERGAYPNVSGGYYGSALRAAAFHNRRDIVQLLLDNGADPNFMCGPKYNNAIHAAQVGGSHDIVSLLKGHRENEKQGVGRVMVYLSYKYGATYVQKYDTLTSDSQQYEGDRVLHGMPGSWIAWTETDPKQRVELPYRNVRPLPKNYT